MATKAAHRRLMKEYAAIQENPPPFIIAKPLEKNILEWHYVITGPPDSPYHNGEYHGKVVFPSEYPFKPPSIQMITPSGRFQPSTKLCLSMSDFHPETWNPSWSVASILTGLLSFMLESTSTTGSIETTEQDKKLFARASRKFNRVQNPKFKEIFPELAEQSSDFTEPEGKKKTFVKEIKVKNLLDSDIVGYELRHFMSNGGFYMLLGGLLIYLLYVYISKL